MGAVHRGGQRYPGVGEWLRDASWRVGGKSKQLNGVVDENDTKGSARANICTARHDGISIVM